MKQVLFLLFLLLCITLSCKKFKQNACQFGDCDSRRSAKLVAEAWNGIMVYDNQINKWGIKSLVTGNPSGRRIAFICGALNDSFKVLDKHIVYSGILRENCDNPRRASTDEEIYYVQPSSIR